MAIDIPIQVKVARQRGDDFNQNLISKILRLIFQTGARIADDRIKLASTDADGNDRKVVSQVGSESADDSERSLPECHQGAHCPGDGHL